MNAELPAASGLICAAASKGLLGEGRGVRAPRALVVDDDPCARIYVSRVLQELGFRVDTADCLRSAVEVISGPWFDVVVSDGHLPDGLGPMVLDRVRNRGRDGDPGTARMLGMTASQDVDLRRAFLEAGAGLVLTKPVPLTTLRAAVR